MVHLIVYIYFLTCTQSSLDPSGGLFAQLQPKASPAKADDTAAAPKKEEEEEKKEPEASQTQTQDEEHKKEELPAKQPAGQDNEKTATNEADKEEQKLPEPETVQPVKAPSLFANTEEIKPQTSLFSVKPAKSETNNITAVDVQAGKVLESNPRTVNSAEGSFHHEANKMLFVSGLVGLFKDHNMGFTNNLLDNSDFVPKMFDFFKEYGVVPPTKNVPQFSVKTGQVQSPAKTETVTAVAGATTTGEAADPREEEKVSEQIKVSENKSDALETNQEEVVKAVVQDQPEGDKEQEGEQAVNVKSEESLKKETGS